MNSVQKTESKMITEKNKREDIQKKITIGATQGMLFHMEETKKKQKQKQTQHEFFHTLLRSV